MTTAKGLLIAAPRSGSGKTMVTLGLLRALSRRGVAVRGAKCGPDYIDPAFHAAACGKRSLTLDAWAMAPAMLRALAADSAAGQDLVLAEASMGLFDGVEAEAGRSGSSADVAAATGWPVLLVLDVSGHSTSAGAVALGCARFDPRVRVAGVVLNRIASERHLRQARDGVHRADVPVLGAIPRLADMVLPERHLGLVQAGETAGLDAILERLADLAQAHLDLDAILACAGPVRDPVGPRPSLSPPLPPPGQRVALASDPAFSFVYPHVVDGWHRAGAEIRTFSPLADEPPPVDCDAVWLPGGYPELHAGRLAANDRFLNGLRRMAETGPVHGECGGYMVLGETLEDGDGRTHRMAGLLALRSSFAVRRLHLGYRQAVLLADDPLGPKGTRLRGHEFHYATIIDRGDDAPFAAVRDSRGQSVGDGGSRRGRVSGSFFHAIAVDAAAVDAAAVDAAAVDAAAPEGSP